MKCMMLQKIIRVHFIITILLTKHKWNVINMYFYALFNIVHNILIFINLN